MVAAASAFSTCVRIRAMIAKLVMVMPRTISTAKVANASQTSGVASGDHDGRPATVVAAMPTTSSDPHAGSIAAANPHAPIAVADSSTSTIWFSIVTTGSRWSISALQAMPKPATSALTSQNWRAVASGRRGPRRACHQRAVHSAASPVITASQASTRPGS